MPVDRDALKKSLYEDDSGDKHTQLLMKGMLSVIETMECLPCDKHDKDIGNIKKIITYASAFIAGSGFIIGVIYAIVKLVK